MGSKFPGKEMGKHHPGAVQQCTSSEGKVLDTSSLLETGYGLVGERLEFNHPKVLLFTLT